jgi:hypothetical protein
VEEALLLLLRAGLTALVVVLAAAAAERAGPVLGGIVATFPVSAGPAYILLSLAHDEAFLAAAALGSLAANAATTLWLLLYVRLAPGRGLWLPLAAATLGWSAAALAIRAVDWQLVGVLALNLAGFALTLALTRRVARQAASGAARLRRRWWDLPLRAVLAGGLVAAVVTGSDALGPAATGIMAVFPVVLTSLSLVGHPRLGGAAIAVLMANVLRGMIGFALATLTLHLAVQPLGAAAGMLAALGTSVLWSVAMLAARRRREV